MDWVIYNDASHPLLHQRGIITHIVSGAYLEALDYVGEGQSVTEGVANPLYSYVDVANGAITSKETLGASLDKLTIVSDGSDIATISGLPQICSLLVNGTLITVTDGQLEFSATKTGAHIIETLIPEYMTERFEVYAI